MAELKMTGNCLKSSRPLLSFDKSFDSEPHLALLKELFTQVRGISRCVGRRVLLFGFAWQNLLGSVQVIRYLFPQIFSVPNFHPKSQPFFDHVYTFSVVDGKIWFRNYQILTEEDGSLAEIGPRFVMQPIKIFGASFSGETLWENGDYVTPTAHRSMMKKVMNGSALFKPFLYLVSDGKWKHLFNGSRNFYHAC